MTAITEFFSNNYDTLVDKGPWITITGFLVFYAVMIYTLYKVGTGSTGQRWAFLALLIALTPNFFAHLSLAIVHGAWTPFIAEVVNIVPVVIYLILNEYYIRKHGDGVSREEFRTGASVS